MSKNIIVGQSGGPTAVINASLAGIFAEARDMEADKIYGMVNGVEGLLKGTIADLSEYIKTTEDIKILCQTPSSFLGSCRFKLPNIEKGNEIFEKIFEKLNELEIEAFFYIGGNDSMDTIKKLANYAKIIGSSIKFIGAPKTIDNDLAVTDHTPGFGSAAKYIATMTKEIICDSAAYDLKSVTILEIMGRNAGWLTGASALARGEDCEGPDLIYLPEIPFDMDSFTEKVKNLFEVKNTLVIAISEGIAFKDGTNVCEMCFKNENLDAFGHKSLTGAAQYLAAELSSNLGCKARSIEFSTLQRAAAHIASDTDINEAFMSGAHAVRAAFDGETGKMVILERAAGKEYKCVTKTYDIDKIANEVKTVPLSWINDEGTNVTEEFINYARPLICGENDIIYKNGLPVHLKLKNKVVQPRD
ncbi:MAG: 6-phosphofructokinase [Bacillota bacterium]|nr:6-phosphofructokinase [Bacillota bacterium]